MKFGTSALLIEACVVSIMQWYLSLWTSSGVVLKHYILSLPQHNLLLYKANLVLYQKKTYNIFTVYV